MDKTTLEQMIMTIGKKKIYQKWAYLFQEADEDTSLFYIEKWRINITKNGSTIIEIDDNEIVGEKSFVSNEWKKNSAITQEEENIVYCITNNEFQKLNSETREKLLWLVTIFLSDRIYKLNSIIQFLWKLSEKLSDSEDESTDSLLEFIDRFIIKDKYIVLRNDIDKFHKINWNIELDYDIIKKAKDIVAADIKNKIWKNYIYIKSKEYIYMFWGEIKLEKYIIMNSLLYTNPIFSDLGAKLEETVYDEYLKDFSYFI